MSKRKLSWKPRRIGDKFCSSACGGGCTLAAYKAAVSIGRNLVKRLNKSKAILAPWKSRIHENLGWFVAVISKCGHVKVHPNSWNRRSSGFHVFLGDPDSPGGRWVGQGSTPEKAVNAAIRAAKNDLGKIAAILVGL